MIEIHSDIESELNDPKYWQQNFLSDLFFACNNVLSHNKKEEYQDLNDIHRQLCDFIDFDKNPTMQKLILMSRDSLKSTIIKGFAVQQVVKALHYNYPLKIGIVTGRTKLSEKHLVNIEKEILKNELIQAYFSHCVPKSKTECDACTQEEFGFRGVEIDIGSLEKSLTGFHYDIIINDNFCDEINTATYEMRKKTRNRWKQHESLIKEGGWEIVLETPWEADDVSGEILDPDGKFDYELNSRKSPAIFVSPTGYAVFSCFVRNKEGKLNFPERLTEAYLARKKRKQGIYIYSRMYEGIITPDEEQQIKRAWIRDNYYDKLPENYIRTMVVDCAGTQLNSSSFSAISLMDTDENGVGYIPYAYKKKLPPLELRDWIREVVFDSEEIDGRPVSMIGVEKEKYGITLVAILREEELNIPIIEIGIKGRPRHARLGATVPLFQFGKIRLKKGLKDCEDELLTYYKGKEKNTDIHDTIFYQFEIQIIPKPMAKVDFVPAIDPTFAQQVYDEKADLRKIANRIF